jgi:hypothetical protein
MSESDKYGKQMWTFVSKANIQMEDLVHDVNNADSMFTDVLNYYGEEDKNISSSEFFAIFKTFVTSYKVSIIRIYLHIAVCDLFHTRNVKWKIKPPLTKNQHWRNASRRRKRVE